MPSYISVPVNFPVESIWSSVGLFLRNKVQEIKDYTVVDRNRSQTKCGQFS